MDMYCFWMIQLSIEIIPEFPFLLLLLFFLPTTFLSLTAVVIRVLQGSQVNFFKTCCLPICYQIQPDLACIIINRRKMSNLWKLVTSLPVPKLSISPVKMTHLFLEKLSPLEVFVGGCPRGRSWCLEHLGLLHHLPLPLYLRFQEVHRDSF